MNNDVALYWVQEAMQTAMLLAMPLLGAALVVGLLVSLFQAITSMQEMTLSYIPKILAVAVILLILTPWMLQVLIDFATQPERVYSHRWQVGDLIIWDERATLHRGRPWPYAEERTLSSLCITAQESDGLASIRP